MKISRGELRCCRWGSVLKSWYSMEYQSLLLLKQHLRLLMKIKTEDTASAVMKCCQEKLGINVSRSDISTCYRITKGKTSKHRKIVVNFATKGLRDQIFWSKKQLRGSNLGLFINEQLTKYSAHIFFECRQLVKQKKISSAWTNNGMVYIKKSKLLNEVPLKISSLEDLVKL